MMKNNNKGFNMFGKQKKTKRKVSTLLYVDATGKSIERALSEFKRRVKNSNMLKELRKRILSKTICC